MSDHGKVVATSAEQAAVIRELERFKAKHDKAVLHLEQLEVERGDLYAKARGVNITYRRIAATFGVTEAAIMQKLTRRSKAAAG